MSYQRLSKAGDFRILVLQQGTQKDPIVCSLIVVAKDCASMPKYEALSYAWGSQADLSFINCNSASLQITTDLEVALKRLRHVEKTRTLWIDQVCINQGDLDERSAQTAIMGNIYESASRVIIWLGEQSSTSDLALDFGMSLSRALHEYGENNGDIDPLLKHLAKVFPETDFMLPLEQNSPWRALYEFFHRRWFQRLWVVQEACLNGVATVYCGGRSVEWSVLLDLAQQLAKYPYLMQLLSFDGSAAEGPQLILKLVKVSRLHDFDSRRLENLVALFSHQVASDPRDYIYSLLSLASDARSLQIIPNYRLATPRVYTDFCRRCIETSSTLDTLHMVERPTKHKIGAIPSWVPDWTSAPQSTYLGVRTMKRDKFSASKTQAPEWRIRDDAGTLTVKGRVIDCIKMDGIAFPTYDLTGEVEDWVERKYIVYSRFESFFRNALEMASIDRSVDQGESAEDVVYRTLLRDCYRDCTMEGMDANGLKEVLRQFRKAIHDKCRVWEKIRDTKGCSWIQRNMPSSSRLVFIWMLACFPVSLVRAYLRRNRTHVSRFMKHFDINLQGNCILATAQGHLANVSRASRIGDVVAIIYGCKTPFVMRPVEQGYTLIGECYVHGIMDGEIIKENIGKTIDITLV